MFTLAKIRTILMLTVGLGIIVWNAVWGNQNLATFTSGLMLCGVPAAFKLDELIKVLPAAIAQKNREVPESPASEKSAAKEGSS